ncbi:MAG: DUF58 domain-containing protein [Proteobacteria bacterium]|nr:DUF58 domain-containing protein [Pseudomonadota bacterium]
MLLRDAELLGQALPPLLVAALHTASTLTFGAHGRKRAGVGDSFFQYRPYEPGESAQRIDWRASARGERLFVREQEWEAAQQLYFWTDGSPSMTYHSNKHLPTKAERANLLALTLASLVLRGGELIASLDGHLPPSLDRMALHRLHDILTHPHDGTSLPPLRKVKSRSHIVLFGDFLPQAAATADWMRHMAGQGVQLILVEVTDPAEETFPFKGPTLFKGMEGEGSEDVADPRTLRRQYLHRRSTLRSALQDAATRTGGHYLVHLTHTEPQAVLLRLYALLAEGGVR